MTVISPSLLSCDFLNIESELNCLKNETNIWLHLDIMDGHFVPNLTFGAPISKMISKKTSIPLDAHLMVTNPEFHINEFAGFGIHNLTFHYESCQNNEEVLRLIKLCKTKYKSTGVSIKPKTPTSALPLEILNQLDLVLVMSVEPGFGGQSFIENSYNKVEELKKIKKENNFTFAIQIDGGVTNKNASQLISAGCDNLVAGSYVFKDGQRTYHEKIESLRNF